MSEHVIHTPCKIQFTCVWIRFISTEHLKFLFIDISLSDHLNVAWKFEGKNYKVFNYYRIKIIDQFFF